MDFQSLWRQLQGKPPTIARDAAWQTHTIIIVVCALIVHFFAQKRDPPINSALICGCLSYILVFGGLFSLNNQSILGVWLESVWLSTVFLTTLFSSIGIYRLVSSLRLDPQVYRFKHSSSIALAAFLDQEQRH